MNLRLGSKIGYVLALLALPYFISVLANAGILDDMEESSRELVVVIGETQPLSVLNPRQVKIGNPDLLDVVGAGRTELLLSGLEAGETQLTVVDDRGQRVYNVKVYQEDLEKLKERVDILLETAGFGQLSTKIGDKERKIFITGEALSSKKESFESRIASVKDKIINLVDFTEEVLSVEIDVEVLEIDKAAVDNLGLAWSEKSYQMDNSRITDFLSPSHTLKVLKFPWQQDSWTVTLHFLKERDKLRVLSRPKLVCLSGKKANLLVGGERPVVTGATTTVSGGVPTTQYEIEMMEYGVELDIEPTIKDNDEIQILLETEVSEIDEDQSLELETFSTPGKITSTAQTELTVMSGQTVLIGGLISSKSDVDTDGISGLASIPILGALFRHKYRQDQEKELVITLTPTIIRKDSQASELSAPSTDKVTLPRDALKRAAVDQAAALFQKDDPVINYSNLIQNIINSNIRYPEGLGDEYIEGTVNLSLHLLSSGELSGVIVMQSSGSAVLDETAEYSVRKLSPFPAFPSEIQLNELWIEVPIVYKK